MQSRTLGPVARIALYLQRQHMRRAHAYAPAAAGAALRIDFGECFAGRVHEKQHAIAGAGLPQCAIREEVGL